VHVDPLIRLLGIRRCGRPAEHPIGGTPACSAITALA
jgi:hypothetical protein